MSFLQQLLLIFGLAMDGFGAAVCMGLCPGQSRGRRLLAAGAITGFHMLLFALGYFLGALGAEDLGLWGDYLPGLLLTALGGLSLNSCRKKAGNEMGEEGGQLKLRRLMLLSLSSSIDAMMVGLSFALWQAALPLPLLLVGLVMGSLSLAGVFCGRLLGGKFRDRAEMLGGVLLCLMGLKNLL